MYDGIKKVYDNPIKVGARIGFTIFVGKCSTDINMLGLKLSEEDMEVVLSAFNKVTSQIWDSINAFVKQQSPLNSETVYGEYSDMIKDIQSSIDMFLDKCPWLDGKKINGYLFMMNNMIENAVNKMVLKDTQLKDIDITSRNAECKSLGI